MPLQLISQVEAEAIRWLWPGRIPFGMLTLVDGDPGLGKSTFMLDLMARLSTGRPLPLAGRHEPMSSLIVTIEDPPATVIRPRLENAGADLERIGLLRTYTNEEGAETLPTLPDDLLVIEDHMAIVDARLVMIDPVMTYLGDKVNANNTQQVLRALTPLADLAERTRAAIVMLRHLNKDRTGAALYRGQGAMGFIGVARSAMIVARDPDHEGLVVVAQNKSNLGPPVPSLTFALVNCENGASRVDWGGATAHTAESILAAPPDAESRAASREAEQAILDALADGPLLARALDRARREADISDITFRRVRADLARRGLIHKEKARTQDGAFAWELSHPVETETDERDETDEKDEIVHVILEESQQSHLSHVSHSPGMSEIAVNGRAAPGVMLAERDGMADCPRCGAGFFAVEGSPALCSGCKGALGLLGRRA